MKGNDMIEFEATRWCAENKGGSQSIDFVAMTLESGLCGDESIQISHDMFEELFGVRLKSGVTRQFILRLPLKIEEVK